MILITNYLERSNVWTNAKNYVVVYVKKVHFLRNKIIDLEQIVVVPREFSKA
jgi:hypothetical protein